MKRWIARLATGAALLLAVAVAYYGAYLLIVGQRMMGVAETNGGPLMPVAFNAPTTSGVFPLIGGVVLVAGLLLRLGWLYWLGFGVVATFSVLFLFGVGGVVCVPASMLLLALAVKGIFERAVQDKFTTFLLLYGWNKQIVNHPVFLIICRLLMGS